MQRIILSIIGLIIRILRGDLRKKTFKEIVQELENNKDIGFNYTIYTLIIIGSIIALYVILRKV